MLGLKLNHVSKRGHRADMETGHKSGWNMTVHYTHQIVGRMAYLYGSIIGQLM